MARDQCQPKCCSKHITTWILLSQCVGILFLILSMFIPRWRVDDIGTQTLEVLWVFSGFKARQYGLLQIKGTYSQSWNALTGSVCQLQSLGLVYNAGAAIGNAMTSAVNWVDGLFRSEGGTEFKDIVNITAGCSGSANCAQGFSQHLWTRCTQYEKIWKASLATLALTFLAIVLVLAGILLASLTSTKKTGGVSLLFFIGASIFSLIVNCVWAVVTDFAFKSIMESAWFPYPSLAISYFLHLYGGLIIATSTGFFAYVVLPKTWAYDPEQEKIDKRNKRLAKLAAKNKLGRPGQMPPVAAMNFPAPPGYGGHPCQGGAPPQFAQYPGAAGPMVPVSGPMVPQSGPMVPPSGAAYHGVGGPQMPTSGPPASVPPSGGDFGIGGPQPPASGGFAGPQQYGRHQAGQEDFGVGMPQGGPAMPAYGGSAVRQSYGPAVGNARFFQAQHGNLDPLGDRRGSGMPRFFN